MTPLIPIAAAAILSMLAAVTRAWRNGYAAGLRANAPELPPIMAIQDRKPRRTERL